MTSAPLMGSRFSSRFTKPWKVKESFTRLAPKATYKQETYHSLGRFDHWPVHAVQLTVEATRVAQVVSSSVPSPKRCRQGRAVDTFPTFLVEFGVVWNRQ